METADPAAAFRAYLAARLGLTAAHLPRKARRSLPALRRHLLAAQAAVAEAQRARPADLRADKAGDAEAGHLADACACLLSASDTAPATLPPACARALAYAREALEDAASNGGGEVANLTAWGAAEIRDALAALPACNS